MVLGFRTKNPKTKSDTCFEALIMNGYKKHTLRKGHRWKEGMSIQMATGVRTKNYRQFNINRPDLAVCKGVQSIKFKVDKNISDTFPEVSKWSIFIDGRKLSFEEMEKLAWNDGFGSLGEFLAWFEKEKDFPDQIVHWTNLIY
jgi:hypothetical protein